jgi:hypothetical protein
MSRHIYIFIAEERFALDDFDCLKKTSNRFCQVVPAHTGLRGPVRITRYVPRSPPSPESRERRRSDASPVRLSPRLLPHDTHDAHKCQTARTSKRHRHTHTHTHTHDATQSGHGTATLAGSQISHSQGRQGEAPRRPTDRRTARRDARRPRSSLAERTHESGNTHTALFLVFPICGAHTHLSVSCLTGRTPPKPSITVSCTVQVHPHAESPAIFSICFANWPTVAESISICLP